MVDGAGERLAVGLVSWAILETVSLAKGWLSKARVSSSILSHKKVAPLEKDTVSNMKA